MSLLSLPPEILLTIVEDEELSKGDMKCLRLVHRAFSPYTERKLFSDIRLKFDKETTERAQKQKLSSTTALSRVKLFVESEEDEKYLPNKVRNLSISVKHEQKTGLKTFLQRHAKPFLGHFKEIGCLKLDLKELEYGGRKTDGKLADIVKVVESCEVDGLKIGQLELIARWTLFSMVKGDALPSSLKKLTVVTIPRKDIFHNNMPLVRQCRGAVQKALSVLTGLECLDLSGADRSVSMNFLIPNPVILEELNEEVEVLNLHTLIVMNSQLPSRMWAVRHLTNLENLIIKEKDTAGYVDHFSVGMQTAIWHFLMLSAIKLRHVEVPVLSDNLINYIVTQGAGSIERLELTSTSALLNHVVSTFIPQTKALRQGDVVFKTQLEALALRFSKEAIPAIASSLKHLTLYMRIVHVQVGPNKISAVNIKSRLIHEADWEEDPTGVLPRELTGFHDMMNLIKGCVKLETIYISVWDPGHGRASPSWTFSKAESLVKDWIHRQTADEKEGELWKQGMHLVIEWKYPGYSVDNCARSEFVLTSKDGVWWLARIKRVNF